jgi:hypothetical protein
MKARKIREEWDTGKGMGWAAGCEQLQMRRLDRIPEPTEGHPTAGLKKLRRARRSTVDEGRSLPGAARAKRHGRSSSRVQPTVLEHK